MKEGELKTEDFSFGTYTKMEAINDHLHSLTLKKNMRNPFYCSSFKEIILKNVVMIILETKRNKWNIELIFTISNLQKIS